MKFMGIVKLCENIRHCSLKLQTDLKKKQVELGMDRNAVLFLYTGTDKIPR